MEPTIEILIGSPVSGSEAAALRDIVSALHAPALILANFEVSRAGTSHQIDFVVVTDKRAELIELKSITAPIKGGLNGVWQIETSPNYFIPYEGPNPWEQAKDAKLAFSDSMHDYAKHRPEVPKPTRRRYFEQFDASVTLYPVLVSGSQICAGNFKAWVRSFPDTLDALIARPFPIVPTWGIGDWKKFAVHLGLVSATLAEAVDASVFRACQRLDAYAAGLQRFAVAPLLSARDKELIGQNVIDKLRGPADAVLLGRSGLGKSFHLEHYRRTCLEADEIPILLQVRYYQRDLNRAIHKSIGQFTPLTPAELLDAAKRLGRRPVLIVDAWNDCPGPMQTDLGADLGAFKLRYDARLIVASQMLPSHPLFATTARVELDGLRQEHKRTIFAFHAGRQVSDIPAHCCAPFSTAFDLSIAGRCHTSRVSQTRAELYDSYVRTKLPSFAARLLLRKFAWYMGENFKPSLPVADYESTVERLAGQIGVPITATDELLGSRLLTLEREVVTFEHDLLREYLRAEQLTKETNLGQLVTRLQEPKYAGLAEFVISMLDDEQTVGQLLATVSVDLLTSAFRGWLGAIAMRIVRAECQRLLRDCRDHLADVQIEAEIEELENGRKFVSGAYVVGSACAADLDRKLCAVVAGTLDDELVRTGFLELLDVGEWALKRSAENAAREVGLKPIAVWRELVHHNVILSHARPVHALLFTCHEIREQLQSSIRRVGELPIRAELLSKVHCGSAGVLPLLLLMFDLRYSGSLDVTDLLAIVRQAWDTKIATLQMECLDFVHSNSRAISDTGPQAEAAIVALLDTFDVSKNIFLSTQWLETRACFDGFETGIDTDGALGELRRILAVADVGDDPLYQLERETDSGVTFTQFLGRWASSALGKIFEDVFQGVYYDAYVSLSDSERRRLLILALHDPHFGMTADWCMKELGKMGWEGAEDVLRRFGSRIDPEAVCPQDCVECFIIANQAWATIGTDPIPYANVSHQDDQAWAVVGELIFWLSRKDATKSADRLSFLCEELMRLPQALPDVLREISHCHKGMGAAPILGVLFSRHTSSFRNALHESLNFEGRLTSIFRHARFYQRELFVWTISALGDFGNSESIKLLLPWTDTPMYGKDAIRAIEQIEQRVATSPGG